MPVQVLIDGRVVGFLERNVPGNLTIKPTSRSQDKDLTLDIVVHALGRVNFGCVWDFKGLIYPDIKLNGAVSSFSLSTLPDSTSSYSPKMLARDLRIPKTQEF